MEFRNLEIKIHSANDLKDVNLVSKMDVYVVVSISGDTRSKQRTPVDKDGGKNPKWNNPIPMKFTINETLARQQNQTLHFLIRAEKTFGDRDIGEIYVPIKELLEGADVAERTVSYSVRTTSGKARGVLHLSYKFGEKYVSENKSKQVVDEPVMAYPPGMVAGGGSSAAYPTPQYHQSGYYAPPPAYPPQPGYGYPPPGYGGYGGYPAQPQMVQQPQKKKNNSKFGLGLGAGLLGGLLVGDMISDVGEMGAYDAGFDDGFDF